MSRNHRPAYDLPWVRAPLAADDANQLRGWIDRARYSEFGPLVRFADGLQKDISAVTGHRRRASVPECEFT